MAERKVVTVKEYDCDGENYIAWFRFRCGQQVKTDIGSVGVVRMCAIQGKETKYLVEFCNASTDWFEDYALSDGTGEMME